MNKFYMVCDETTGEVFFYETMENALEKFQTIVEENGCESAEDRREIVIAVRDFKMRRNKLVSDKFGATLIDRNSQKIKKEFKKKTRFQV